MAIKEFLLGEEVVDDASFVLVRLGRILRRAQILSVDLDLLLLQFLLFALDDHALQGLYLFVGRVLRFTLECHIIVLLSDPIQHLVVGLILRIHEMLLVDLVLDDGIRESLDLIVVGVELVGGLGVGLSGARVSHEILIYLVHESLVILAVRPIESAINLKLPLFGILFYRSHQVGCAFWSVCLGDIDDVVHQSGHDGLVEILIGLRVLHDHRHIWKIVRTLTLELRNILPHSGLNGELPLSNV